MQREPEGAESDGQAVDLRGQLQGDADEGGAEERREPEGEPFGEARPGAVVPGQLTAERGQRAGEPGHPQRGRGEHAEEEQPGQQRERARAGDRVGGAGERATSPP